MSRHPLIRLRPGCPESSSSIELRKDLRVRPLKQGNEKHRRSPEGVEKKAEVSVIQ